jgi:protein phosphatase
MKTKFRLNTFAATDLGQTSDNNEDSILCQVADHGTAALLVVADGMGGHLAGEQASYIVIETVGDAMSGWLTEAKSLPSDAEETAEQIAEALHTAVQQANRNVFKYAQENLEEGLQMGSTAACAFIQESVAALANVGDSRVYLLRQGHLYRLTEDHSLV